MGSVAARRSGDPGVALVCVRPGAIGWADRPSAQVARSRALAQLIGAHSLAICAVAAVSYVAVNEHEPSRRVATALKFLIVTLAVAAIVDHF
jgi:Tfp pilus assembly protein PilN